MSLERVTCPVCLRAVVLRAGGELREHLTQEGISCVASGLTLEEVHDRIDAEVEALRKASSHDPGSTA